MHTTCDILKQMTITEKKVLFHQLIELDKMHTLLALLHTADDSDCSAVLAGFTDEEQQMLLKRIAAAPQMTEQEHQQAVVDIGEVVTSLRGKVRILEERSRTNLELRTRLRATMKATDPDEFGISDQTRGIPFPSLQKSVPPAADLITLPIPSSPNLVKESILVCINERRSHRQFSTAPVTLNDLAYLLWCTQGIRRIIGKGYATLRTVPSGGARHAFETYLAVNRVESLEPGIYRYVPLDHALLDVRRVENLDQKLTSATMGQKFVGTSAVVFIWSVVPYRAEWRYTIGAYKSLLLDAGHVCQNLYLACESLGLGTCAIAAYHQKQMDDLLQLNDDEEFTIYLSPVGIPID